MSQMKEAMGSGMSGMSFCGTELEAFGRWGFLLKVSYYKPYIYFVLLMIIFLLLKLTGLPYRCLSAFWSVGEPSANIDRQTGAGRLVGNYFAVWHYLRRFYYCTHFFPGLCRLALCLDNMTSLGIRSERPLLSYAQFSVS